MKKHKPWASPDLSRYRVRRKAYKKSRHRRKIARAYKYFPKRNRYWLYPIDNNSFQARITANAYDTFHVLYDGWVVPKPLFVFC